MSLDSFAKARLVALVLVVLSVTTGMAAERPTLLFILDASGSMWGRVEGEAKIEVARRVMGELAAGLPSELDAGLMAYGHRRKGDCADIEVLASPSRDGGRALAATLDSLVPRGKTPIAQSLTRAGGLLAGREEATSIVLVSDGIETCSGNPCAVAASLREQGIPLTIHVVGFDVGGPAVEQLRCVARAGGGRYFQASNATELATAVGALRDHVVEQAPLPEPPPAPEVETTAAPSKRVRIAAAGTVKLDPAPWVAMPPRFWFVADAETGEPVARSASDTLRVKPGTYQIGWRQREHGAADVLLSEVVTVKPGNTREVPLATGLRLTLPKGMAPPRAWKLVTSEGEVAAAFSETLGPEVVPAGSYRLVWRQSEHRHPDLDLGEVEVKGGQLNDVVLGTGLVVKLPDWLSQPYYYELSDGNGRSYRLAETGAQLLPPGDWTVTWRQSEHRHGNVAWGTATVPGGGLGELAIDSGLTFMAGDAPAPYRVSVEDLTTGAKAVMSNQWGPMPLPPGRYRVDLREKQHGSSTVTLIDELEIEPGQLIEIDI